MHETQRLALVFAVAHDELVMLIVRSWPRDDVDREVERILQSFEIIGSYVSAPVTCVLYVPCEQRRAKRRSVVGKQWATLRD